MYFKNVNLPINLNVQVWRLWEDTGITKDNPHCYQGNLSLPQLNSTWV